MKIYRTLVLRWVDNQYIKVHEDSYEYNGEVSLTCGASGAQNQIEQSQQSFANQVQGQAGQIFGQSSSVFNDLMNTFSPIVAAGPGQQGFTPTETSALNSQAITGVGQSYKNEKQALGDQQAAQGGGRAVLPGGASTGPQLQLAENAGNQTAGELNQITQANYNQGRQNWLSAASGLASAPGVFGTALGADSTTGGLQGGAANTANQIAQENAGPLQAVIGAAGSVAGAAAGNPALFSGGSSTPTMSSLGWGGTGAGSLAGQVGGPAPDMSSDPLANYSENSAFNAYSPNNPAPPGWGG